MTQSMAKIIYYLYKNGLYCIMNILITISGQVEHHMQECMFHSLLNKQQTQAPINLRVLWQEMELLLRVGNLFQILITNICYKEAFMISKPKQNYKKSVPNIQIVYHVNMHKEGLKQLEKILTYMMFMEHVMDTQRMIILIIALLVWIRVTFKGISINLKLKPNCM